MHSNYMDTKQDIYFKSLKLHGYIAGYLFKGYYFGAIMESPKIEKIIYLEKIPVLQYKPSSYKRIS